MLGSRITSSNTQAQKRGGDMFWYICPLSNHCTLQLQLDVQKPLIPRTLYICRPWIWELCRCIWRTKTISFWICCKKSLSSLLEDLHDPVANTSSQEVGCFECHSGQALFFQGFKSKEGIHWLFALAKTNSSPITNLIFFGLLPSKCWNKILHVVFLSSLWSCLDLFW